MMKRVFLGIVFAMTCRTFQYFPGMGVVQEAWFGVCFLYLLTVYPFFKAKTGWRLSWFELYIFVLMIIVPLLSAYSAWRQFGQPFTYGFLSQRGVVLLSGALMLIQGLRHRFFALKDVEKSLLGLAWGVAILHLLMRAFLNPANYVSYGPGFATISGEDAFFVLPIFFPVFGFFYYAFLGFRTRQTRYYAFAGFLMLTLLNNSGARALTVALLSSFLFFVYRWGGMVRATMLFGRMVLILALLLGTIYVVNPESLVSRSGKFADAFAVAFTGNEVADPSANARIFEVLLAASYLPQHPWLGNGNISNQWQGGNEGVLGEYFHPSDIGIIGVLFVYGILGFLIFAWQYSFAVRAVKQQRETMQSPLLDATKGVLLFMALNSITTGFFVFTIEVNCLFIALLLCMMIGPMRSSQRLRPASPMHGPLVLRLLH